MLRSYLVFFFMKFETIFYVCVKISSFRRERKKEKKSATGCKVKAKKQNKTTFISSHTFPLNCVTGQEQQLVFLNKSLRVKKNRGAGGLVILNLHRSRGRQIKTIATSRPPPNPPGIYVSRSITGFVLSRLPLAPFCMRLACHTGEGKSWGGGSQTSHLCKIPQTAPPHATPIN